MRGNYWVDSGMAAEAARELIWFVVLVFVGITVVMIKEIKKEIKEANDERKKKFNV